MANIKTQLTQGIGWVAGARVLVSGLGLASTILLARILSPSDFGIVAVANAVLAIVQSITQLSLSSALIHRSESVEDDIHTVWTLSLIRAAIITGVLGAISGLVARTYHDERLVPIMLVIAITGGLSGLTNPRIGLQAKHLNFRVQFMYLVVQKIALVSLSILLALYMRNYWSLVYGSLFSVAVTTLFSYFVVPYQPRLRLRNTRYLFSYSIWLSLSQLTQMLGWRSDQLLIGFSLTDSELGAYVVADNLASIPTREVTQPLTQVLFPGLTRLVDNNGRLTSAYLLAQSTLTLAALPLGFGFAMVAEPVILLMIGDKWRLAIGLIQVFSCMFAIRTLAAAAPALAMATNNNKLLFSRDVQALCMRVPLVLCGLWIGGLQGVAYARALAEILDTIVGLYVVKTITGLAVTQQVRGSVRSILATVVMLALTWPIMDHDFGSTGIAHATQIGMAVLAGGLVYASTVAIQWHLSGRPDGPENEILRLISSITRRARPLPE